MSRTLVAKNWKRLAQAARKERDPKKFVYLLKQLYDVVNVVEQKSTGKREQNSRRTKTVSMEREPKAA